MDKEDLRRVEKLEERLNQAEQKLASLTAELSLINSVLTTRMSEVNLDFKERLESLKTDISSDIDKLGTGIDSLKTALADLAKSLNNLAIDQKGSSSRVNTNEKIIWWVVGIVGSVILISIQFFIKSGHI